MAFYKIFDWRCSTMAMDAFSASLMKDKREIVIAPTIYKFDTFDAFAEEFQLGERDVVLTNEFIYKPFMEKLGLKSNFVFQEKFGAGEPSEAMIETMYEAIPYDSYDRVIAVGGGAIMDLCKLLGCKRPSSVHELYFKREPVVHEKEVIAIPTTCGTGSEVTNISILALNSRGTKKGLAVDQMYADTAVLIPELLEGLPFGVFATSSIDALIHAIESSLSPKGNETTRLLGYQAISMILNGYKEIAEKGKEARIALLSQFLMASNYAGIAFANAGCAAVHAMSYPLGATYHVAHGESNYAMFTGVMKNYMELKTDGEIAVLNKFIAHILGCDEKDVYEELEKLLNVIIQKKTLHEYGMKESEIEEFADSVLENQQRLLANNFVPLDRDRLIKIYRELY